jgi:ABC-type protease/lipase transport system fused ATPase/permease subunit
MPIESLLGLLGFVATLLLVLVGLLNFSIFRKQLRIAKEQIDTAVRQLEIAQKQPDLYLINAPSLRPQTISCSSSSTRT